MAENLFCLHLAHSQYLLHNPLRANKVEEEITSDKSPTLIGQILKPPSEYKAGAFLFGAGVAGCWSAI